MGAQLVILAAGIGRRFGGLKQLASVGPRGEAILDYTVFDALRSGFDHVVLVIRDEIEEVVRAHVAKGFGRRVDVDFVYQNVWDLPEGTGFPSGRTKPWGTGHAVLAARSAVTRAFAVANADDLYGAEALATLGAFLTEPPTTPPTWAMVGFPAGTTLPNEGAVSRALVRVEGASMQAIDEVYAMRRHPDGACWDEGGELIVVPPTAPVSMNLWGFTPEIVSQLATRFSRFLEDLPTGDPEFLLPATVGDLVAGGLARVRVLSTESRWCGMTSARDLESVRTTVAGLIAAGVYPDPLWG